MNHYPRHLGDYAKDTGHLSTTEHGAYNLLIDWYYASEKPVPADKAYRIAKASSEIERQAVDNILADFFTREGETWVHKRIEEELAKYREKSEKARNAATLSVEARKKNNRELRAARLNAARIRGTHTDYEWEAMKEICGGCCQCGATERIQKDHIKPIYQGGSDGIDNIQPLCVSCNASKGPDCSDLRPANWKRLLSERLTNAQHEFSERSTNQEPRTSNQEPLTNLIVLPAAGALAPTAKKQKADRGTRLPKDFQLPKAWGEWAMEQGFTREMVLFEAEKFRDHWVAKPGKDANKLDWLATWRNWIRNSKSGIRKTFTEQKQDFLDAKAKEFYQPLLDMTPDERKAWGFE